MRSLPRLDSSARAARASATHAGLCAGARPADSALQTRAQSDTPMATCVSSCCTLEGTAVVYWAELLVSGLHERRRVGSSYCCTAAVPRARTYCRLGCESRMLLCPFAHWP